MNDTTTQSKSWRSEPDARISLYQDFTLTEDNCSEEPVHRPVAIQDQGHLLVIDTAASPKLHAISNRLATCLGHSTESIWSEPNFNWLPKPLQALIAKANISHRLPQSLNQALTLSDQTFHVSHHRHDDKLSIEFEPEADTQVEDQFIRTAAHAFRQVDDLESLYALASTLIAQAFGYDRVMIYQFDDDQHGCVVGEQKIERLEPFLGLHYPETDIPKIARDLFLLTKSRSIPDVNAHYAPLVFNPSLGMTPPYLDLSYSQLRATSPIHIDYLKNMGVAATLTFAIVVNGKLWGLVACHHYAPRQVLFTHKAIGEVTADLLAKRILEIEVEKQTRIEAAARAVESRLLAQVSMSDNYRVVILEQASSIIELCEAEGAALITLDQCAYRTGLVPDNAALLAIRDWLVSNDHLELFSTTNFAGDVPVTIDQAKPIGGMLATCISSISKSYLMWFRRPVSQTVNWAGDPKNSYSVEPALDGGDVRISPRHSFAKWQVSTEGQSLRWEDSALEMADRVRQGIFKFELRHTATLIERNNKEFMQLTFTAAHDLQEPLRTQANYIELLNQCLEENEHEELPHFVNRLENATRRMNTLVTDLLHYSSLGTENKREDIDLTALLAQIVDEFDLSITETQTTVHIAELPTIRGDSNKLRQCLENLITNAIKYVAPGVTPEISIYMERNDSFVTLNIKDNGIGIDPQFHSKIFTMFQRLHDRNEYRGTGIGLAICAKVAESMGAEIGVTSAVGEGSTFWLRLHDSLIV